MQSRGIQIWLPTWQHWKSGSEHPYWILISFSTCTSWPAMFTHMFSRWCCSLTFSSLLIIISTLKETSTQLLNFLSPTSSLLTPCRGAPHQVIILLQPSSSYTSHSPPWAWPRSNFPPTSSLPARPSPPPQWGVLIPPCQSGFLQTLSAMLSMMVTEVYQRESFKLDSHQLFRFIVE